VCRTTGWVWIMNQDSTSNQRQNCLRHLRPQKKTTFTTSHRQNYRFDHLRPPKPPPSPPQTAAEMVNV
ncbi:hypothetical protein KUCAC02_033005, partial [Chaenocephalus aceratus]